MPLYGGRRSRLAAVVGWLLAMSTLDPAAGGERLVIDDFARQDLVSSLGTRWRGVSDRVMGGVSVERVALDEIDGRRCLRLTGDVRLENDGGFIQMALDLAPGGGVLDAGGYSGLDLLVRGNGEAYGAHLRTADVVRPWQAYRARFTAGPRWERVRLPFAEFAAHRIDAAFDASRLRRLGLVAIGRAFSADLCVAEVSLYQ